MIKKIIIAFSVFAAIGIIMFLTPVKTYFTLPEAEQSTLEPPDNEKQLQTLETVASFENVETETEMIYETELQIEIAPNDIETEEVQAPIETIIEDVEVIEGYNLVYLGEFKFTAYCPCPECCGIYSSGYTATGTWATEGRTIAVDPTVIPYGSKVLINNHIYIAEDCGGAIKGNRIDMFFNDHNEANIFGIKYFDVYLVREK